MLRYHWKIKGSDASGLDLKYEVWKPGQVGLSGQASGTAQTTEECMELIHGIVNNWEKQRIHESTVTEGDIEVPKTDQVPDSLPEEWSN